MFFYIFAKNCTLPSKRHRDYNFLIQTNRKYEGLRLGREYIYKGRGRSCCLSLGLHIMKSILRGPIRCMSSFILYLINHLVVYIPSDEFLKEINREFRQLVQHSTEVANADSRDMK